MAHERENKRISLDDLIDYLGFGKYTAKLMLMVGVLYTMDGSALTLLVFKSPLKLSDKHTTWLLLAEQIGIAIGGFYWGWLADKRGRQRIGMTCAMLTLYFGILNGFEDGFAWSVVLKSIFGFGMGGAVVAPCYLAEAATSKTRGRVITSLQIFFRLGALYTSIFALLVVNKYGWNTFLIVTAIPVPFFIILLARLPESLQYLRNSGDYSVMLKRLQHISVEHEKPFPIAGIEIECRATKRRGKMSILVSSPYLLKFFVMIVLSFTGYFCYFGAILRHTHILKSCPSPLNLKIGTVADYGGLEPKCRTLSDKDYLQYIYAIITEMVAITLILPMIDVLGRKKILTSLLIVNIACFLISLYVDKMLSPNTAESYFLFIFRACASTIIAISVIYTTELFPTVVRGCALAVCACSSRVGVIAVTYLHFKVLHSLSIVSLVVIFIGLCVITLMMCLLLPERNGKMLDNK